MSYQSRRLKYALLMSLGASPTLRRQWFRGCWILMGACVVGFLILSPFEVGSNAMSSNIVQMLMYACVLGFFASIGGLGTWFLAGGVNYVGRQVRNDYRRGKLFD